MGRVFAHDAIEHPIEEQRVVNRFARDGYLREVVSERLDERRRCIQQSVAVDKDEYDVFGDGTVVMKAAPGHTPGHQVLILQLASTGRVMIAGDLYHYPPERAFHRAPPDNEFNVQQSAASRGMIEEYLTKTRTTIWIEHDFGANAKLKKSPRYYD